VLNGVAVVVAVAAATVVVLMFETTMPTAVFFSPMMLRCFFSLSRLRLVWWPRPSSLALPLLLVSDDKDAAVECAEEADNDDDCAAVVLLFFFLSKRLARVDDLDEEEEADLVEDVADELHRLALADMVAVVGGGLLTALAEQPPDSVSALVADTASNMPLYIYCSLYIDDEAAGFFFVYYSFSFFSFC
jgi:hypothetical protein